MGAMSKWRGPPHEKIKRCGAKTRPGHPCGHYAMSNGRCRYHGGKSTGANKPYRSLKHGFYTKDAIAERKTINKLLMLSKKVIENM